MITCANPHAQYLRHKASIQFAIQEVLAGGNYILGPNVAKLEHEFAQYLGCKHAIGLNSGTDALILGLKLLGVGPGDEVITVSHTALATVSAIVATGATPRLVDIEEDSLTISSAEIRSAVNSKTKAIIAVHVYGMSCDLNAIMSISREHSIPVIEDCAQSAGAVYGGVKLGVTGALGCFSFYPTKNLGAIGDGGMIVTNDPELAERAQRIRQYGWDMNRNAEEPGVNSRLDEIQAAILRVKLKTLDEDNSKRIALAERYDRDLGDLPIKRPILRKDRSHVYHLYAIQAANRDGLKDYLYSNGVAAGIHYSIPPHRLDGYAKKVLLHKELKATERVCNTTLSLPMYPELTEAEQSHVIHQIRFYYNKN